MNLQNKTKEELIEIAQALKALEEKVKYKKIETYFQDVGEFSRDKYIKHMELMQAGLDHPIRAFIGGNGTGKSVWGSLETYYHASGKYPVYWTGRKYKKAINGWICARENKQLRDSIQEILFGSFSDIGTGIIPREDLLDADGKLNTWAMAGTANCIGSCLVRHYDKHGKFDGTYSKIEFKTYAQGWQEFQGSTRQWIWMDEEPDDAKVYAECLARTRGPKGREGSILCTFTPLLGYSTVYLSFLPSGQLPKDGINPNNPNKYACIVTWDDIPHLSAEWKKSQIEEWKLTDPNSIAARTNGIAAMGSGRIYPVDSEQVIIKPIEIQEYWPRAYGLDFGWNTTAALWGARDPATNILYIYSEYYRGKVAPYVHAQNIQSKGKWIPGIADPSGGGRSNQDGSMLIDDFRNLGLDLIEGENGIQSGIGKILNMLESGQLKFFNTCENLIREFLVYRYDLNDPNKPARNQDDHALDALKYLVTSFDFVAKSYEEIHRPNKDVYDDYRSDSFRDDLTGY